MTASDGTASWALTVGAGTALTSALALWYFASPSVSYRARAQVVLAWMLSLSIVALVPLDVVSTMRADAPPEGLAGAWDWAYWSTFASTWFIIPLHQCYEDAADFSSVLRLKRALRENGIMFGIMFGLVTIGSVVMLASESLSLSSLRAYGIVLGNVWGISTGVLLMGFGLVDVPRSIWLRAGYAGRLQRAYKRVAGVSRSLHEAHAKLAAQVTAVATTSRVMPRRHELRWAMSAIENETPEFASVHRGSLDDAMDAAEDDVLDYDYDELNDLVKLRRTVRRCVRVYNRTRAQYVLAIESAFHCEALESSRTSSMRRMYRSPTVSVRDGSLGKCLDDLEYTWSVVLTPILLRLLAIGLTFFSVSIIMAESTIWVGTTWGNADQLSMLSVIVGNAETSSALHLVVAFPLFYMCGCAFYSLFKLGMFSFYQLVPRNTDAYSLLVNASLVCRYSAPLSYNYLMLLPIIKQSGKVTTFSQKMASNVPEVAGELNVIVPAFLGLFCLAIALNWFDALLKLFRADNFKFESDKDKDESVDAGKAIVDRERAEVIEGGRIGSTNDAFFNDNEPTEQRLPVIATDASLEGEEREARSSLLSSDLESGSARWDNSKARLQQAMQQSMNRSGRAARTLHTQPRGSPMSQSGQDKVSKLDELFSDLSRHGPDGNS